MTDAAGHMQVQHLTGRRFGRHVAVYASLFLVFAAAGAAFFLAQGVDRQMSDVERTFDVRKNARELTSVLIDAESTQRGYLLTQDKSYLQSFNTDLASISALTGTLAEMADDYPEQRGRLATVKVAVDSKIKEMSSTISLVEQGHADLALSVVKGGQGRQIMSDLRSTLDNFIGEEDRRLLDRNATIGQTRLLLIVSILVALSGALVLSYVLFSRSERQVSRMARDQGELSDQRDALATRVRERTAELEESQAHALNERARVETLLKESNHRIGNSLATVSSLLGLQMMRSRSDEVKQALEAARQRVHAIASAHRRLRLGDDLETTDSSEFLSSVLDDLQSGYAGTEAVQFTRALEPISINARDATTLGILVGELVTNSLKHAFPDGRAGTIAVRLFRDPAGVATLEVSDDGRGATDEAALSEGGLGSVIVRQLALQFGGVPVYAPVPNGGLQVTVKVPKLEESGNSVFATL